MDLHRAVFTSLAVAALVGAASARSAAQPGVPAPPPAKVALTNARIIPVSGADIPTGTVLIENGLITAVGADVQVPYDAMEVDCTGKVLFPGMVDPHSARGLDVPNETLAVTPFLDVYDAIDPSRAFFEDSLRDGVTTVHVMQANNTVIGALSRTVRPIGLSIDEMTVRPRTALKLATSPKSGFDRMRQMATLRETFLELEDYTQRLAEKKYEDSLKGAGKTVDVGPAEARKRGRDLLKDEDYDDRHVNLMRLKRGDLAAWIFAGAATDVAPALTIARENGFLDRTVLIVGPEAFRAMSDIKKSGRPVVLPESLTYRDRDEVTGQIEEVFLPKVFHEAGVTFALQPNPDASMAERYLNYQAALCVRGGVPRDAALKAITMNPAAMVGLEGKAGSLQPGAIANIVVLTGDPLDFSTWVELVYIDGILAYDRAKDHRLTEILDLQEANAPTPAPGQAPQGEPTPGEGRP